jgi:hypothetical protein
MARGNLTPYANKMEARFVGFPIRPPYLQRHVVGIDCIVLSSVQCYHKFFFSLSLSFFFFVSFVKANKTRFHYTGKNHTRRLKCSLLETLQGKAKGMELEITHSR